MERIVDIPWNVLSDSVPSFKNCGEFATNNGLEIIRIKYLDSHPVLECYVVDEKVYMILLVKYGL